LNFSTPGSDTYSNEIYACLLGSFEERFPGKDTFGSEIALLSFDKSPIDVKGNGVVTQSLDLLEDIEPQARHGQSSSCQHLSYTQEHIKSHT